MVQSRGRPTVGNGKSLKMTVLVEPSMLEALERAMEAMRDTMPGVRLDRSTAIRHLLSKALVPYVRTSSDPTPDQAPMVEDHEDHKRTARQPGRKRTGAKG